MYKVSKYKKRRLNRYAQAIESVKPEVTESQVASKAVYAMRQAGAEEFGVPVSLPVRVQASPMDLTPTANSNGGALLRSISTLSSTVTVRHLRTVCVGKVTADEQTAYDIYLKAQQATTAKAHPGVTMVELGETMHGVIEESGYKDHILYSI